MNLGLDDDELAACVQCGLCLPHCPTFRVTGEESASPRGRIAAMRQVQWSDAALDEAFTGYMDACVQCRGCETACPSACRSAGSWKARVMCSPRERQLVPPWWRRAG